MLAFTSYIKSSLPLVLGSVLECLDTVEEGINKVLLSNVFPKTMANSNRHLRKMITEK